MSHTLFKEKVKPEVEKDKVLLLMIDNLRYDQWKVIEPLFTRFLQQDIGRLLLQYSADCNTVCKKFILCGAASFRNRKEIP